AMRFKVTHTTHYKYQSPASESFAELRVWPQDSETQRILRRELVIKPTVAVDEYRDYFGNRVEFFSIPFRHQELVVSAMADVETRPPPDVSPLLETSVGEALQIYNSQRFRFYDFLHSTDLVP